MRMLNVAAVFSLALFGWSGSASADPNKDESGKGRERGAYARSYGGVPGFGPEQGDFWGYDDGYERPRRERRAWRDYEDDRDGYGRSRRAVQEFKEEYDDGNCKYERKLEKSGEYKEEVKCRDGRRSSYTHRY